jgi:aminoglycoside 3-N-acetyltransferase
MLVTEDDIIEGVRGVGLEGKAVEVHAALSSFGRVQGEAPAVVRALQRVCDTVAMPTFSSNYVTTPTTGDRPVRNGAYHEAHPVAMSGQRAEPFDDQTFGLASPIDRDMGSVPRALLRLPSTRRSRHPLVSWAANGNRPGLVVDPHPWEDPLAPIKHITGEGFVLLLGVGLTQCTALHLAEEIAGRRPFIRWVLCKDGTIRRVRVPGCSNGFDVFEPHFARFGRLATIGRARVFSYPISAIVETGARLIRQSPLLTICESRCERCLDAAAAGPQNDGLPVGGRNAMQDCLRNPTACTGSRRGCSVGILKSKFGALAVAI